MTHAPPFVAEVVALLVTGAAIAYLGYRVRLVPIVGFLLAGVAIGPHALGLVRRPELVEAAAEAGVILLLFTIGIEFSLEKLKRIRRVILLGGGLQVALASGITLAVLAAFGVPWRPALFTGFLVALSSTAIVLKLLSDRRETGEERGQVAVALLVFQDLAVIAMVLAVPLLGGTAGSGADVAWALARAVGIIAVVLLFARRLMPGVLETVARTCSPEIFLLTVVAICFGTAYVTSLAGVSLSLGAFLAGLLVSESRFSEHALSEILPLQIVFSATFFISVGMLLDLGFVARHAGVVLGATAALLAVKLLTTTAAVRALGHPLPLAAATGLLLAQVGEFSFVLERTGRASGLYPAGLEGMGSQAFIAATVMLMVVTPQLAALGSRLAVRGSDRPARRPVPRRARRAGAADRDGGADAAAAPASAVAETAPRDHVLVSGYGQAARELVRGLDRAGIPYFVTTLSPGGAAELEGDGRRVLRGDSTHQGILDRAGLDRARVVVVADDEAATARRIVSVARTGNPAARIVVRTRYDRDVATLEGAGADRVIAEEEESAAAVLGDVLAAYRDAVRCTHLDRVRDVRPRTPEGCEECLRTGDRWVRLRMCRTCGRVGCCDSSPNRHASRHARAASHPIARSLEAGEDWSWCFVDEVELSPDLARR